MSDTEIVIAIRSDGQSARVIKRSLDDIATSGDKATSSSQRLKNQMDSTAGAATTLNRALQAMAGYFGIQAITRFSDAVTTLETQLKNVTRGTEDYTRKFSDLFRIAQANGDVFGDLAGNFVRLNTSLPDAIRNTTDLTKVTELLSRGFAASGTSAQASSAVMTQLTQGLAGNFANAAQEINSLIEGAPLLAKIIAEQLGGKAATDLKRLAESGDLTAESFLNAVIAAEKAIKAYEIPETIGRSWQRIVNEMTRMVSESTLAEGAAQAVSSALDGVAANLGTVIKAIGVATAGMAAFIVVSNASAISAIGAAVAGNVAAFVSLAATVRNAAGAMALLNAAFLTNPVVLVTAAIVAAVSAVILFKDEINDLLKDFKPFGLEIQKTFVMMGDIVAGTFGGIVEVIKKAISDVEFALYKVTGGKYTPKVEAVYSSFGDAFKAGIEKATVNSSYYSSNAQVLDTEGKSTVSVVQSQSDTSKKAIKEIEEAHKNLASAIKASRTEEERLLEEIAELEKMKGIAQATGQSKELALAISRAKGELEELRIQAERNSPIAKAFESLANQIDDGFRDAFRNAFTQSDGGFKGMIEGWKSTFKTFLADLAYMATVRPVMLSLVGGVGGAMGLSAGASSSIIGSIAGTGGGSGTGLGGVWGNLSSLGSGFLSGSLYSNTLGGIGQGLGNLLTGNAWGMTGPFLPTSAQGLMGGAFGNLGYGAIGGLAANLLGLGGGIGGTIGGTLGSLAGGAVGTGMGTILGFAGGPVGALAGSFLGSALGGLFGGGSVPSRAIHRGFSFQDGQYLQTNAAADEASNEQFSAFDQLSSVITSKVNEFTQMLGATLEWAPFAIISQTRREGIRVGVEGPNYINDNKAQAQFGDLNTAVEYALQGIFEGAVFEGISDDLAAAIKKAMQINPGDLDAAVNDVSFAMQILQQTKSSSELVAEAIAKINEEFDTMYDRAEKLGLPMDKVTEMLEKQREGQIGLVKAMQAGFQSMEAAKASFDSWLYDQSISGQSTLTPAQKLAAAQSNFGDLLSKAQGGDYSVTQQLLQAGQQLLSIGQNMYASSIEFSALEGFVRSSIQQIAHELDIPGYATGTRSAREGLAWVGERGPELINFRGGERVYNSEESLSMARSQARTAAISQEQNQKMDEMNENLRRMTLQVNRLVNKMMVA